MAAPDWEDLGEFFDPDEFAITAKLWRAGELVAEVLGIYDDPTDRKDLGDYTLDETGPRFLCREPAGLTARRGDVAEIEGRLHDLIENPTRDGTGLVTWEMAEPTGSALKGAGGT